MEPAISLMEPAVRVAAPGARVGPATAWSGPVRFARYAFGPNRIGLCGPDDWEALLHAACAPPPDGPRRAGGPSAVAADQELRQLAFGFDGALPYLQLIAAANGIADPLDQRVVDAYWIGNRLVDNVDARFLAESLDTRFRSRVAPAEWRWLATKPAAGATPTHAFHVLDVYPRVGLMRGGELGDTVALMDACRIRWGRVERVEAGAALVAVSPLTVQAGRLALGPERIESVQLWPGDEDALGLHAGSLVSLHWGWLCEVLTPPRAAALAARTRAQVALANQTT
jgi:hypothetical protein